MFFKGLLFKLLLLYHRDIFCLLITVAKIRRFSGMTKGDTLNGGWIFPTIAWGNPPCLGPNNLINCLTFSVDDRIVACVLRLVYVKADACDIVI